MAIELAARLGPSVEAWLAEPYVYALWAYLHLQELDFRESWRDRIRNINKATLQALAHHDPTKLETERRAAYAAAGEQVTAHEREKAEQLARDIQALDILAD